MSSPRQTIEQMRYLATTATWSTSPSSVVVGSSAYVTPGIEDESRLPSRVPFALFNLGDSRADSDDPDLIEQDFIMVVATKVVGHQMGEAHLLGGSSGQSPRSAYSDGRGALEVAVPLVEAMQSLTGADGAPIIVSWQSAVQVQKHTQRELAWQQYVFKGYCTRDDDYPEPSNFTATGGSGEIVMAWTLPAPRYDLSSIIVRYASGATAPATTTDGTGVTLGSDLATGVTQSGLGSGTYSVSVFGRYVAHGENFDSEPITRTSVVVS